jgi:hypothetical protein
MSNLNIETGERHGSATARTILKEEMLRRASRSYQEMRVEDSRELAERNAKRTARLQGRDPARPFIECRGHAMTPEFFAEILERAGERDAVKKSELQEFAKLQAAWDEVDANTQNWTPIAIRKQYDAQFSAAAEMGSSQIAQTRYKTIEEFQNQALNTRRILRSKLVKISDEANVIYLRVLERLIRIVQKVFEQVEAEEQAFARRLKFEDVPSEFRVACGQTIWKLRDSVESISQNGGVIPSPPNSKLNFLLK